MKQLSTLIEDELMQGLDLLATVHKRDRSFFVRQAIETYLRQELPKVPQKKEDLKDLKDLLKLAQAAPPKAAK